MDFFIVFCKTKRKFDKYIKINRIRNKVIINIRELLDNYDIDTNDKNYKNYFNFMVYTKITHSLKKGKNIYYIPNYKNDINISELFKLKDSLNMDIKFNLLLFYDEFINDKIILDEIFDNMASFEASQMIKDY